MRTAVLLSAFAIAGLAGAQVFQSGFENWTGGSPDGWIGSKTNLDAAKITEVNDNVHGGTSAVRLENPDAGHKRFTTQPLTVTNGINYTITFWVRGSGNVRSGLFDGRPGTSSGYAPYGSYYAATSTWTMVTQTVAAANDTTGAEFILSVQLTTGPEQLVIDDVNIVEAGALQPSSIYDIQFTADPNGDSPLNGQTVLTGGIVTADLPAATAGYFVQAGSGPWSGIYVFDADHSPAIGDSVTFSASVTEYFGLTELSGVTNFTTVSTGNALTPYVVATGDVSLEPLESVLVKVMNASCTEIPGGANFGKYKVNDGSGDAVVGKVIYTTVPDPLLGTAYNVTGVNYYAFSEYNILPRMASDVEFASGIADAGVLATVQVGPNPATEQLTVNLGQAANTNVSYTLTDLQGRTLQSGVFTGERGELEVAFMATGLYHLTLRSANMVKSFGVQVVR
ncbi:MAG: T9SS type A sorting domain-containing protein [Flavobacteriales bacterium]